ncbi:hypothetical protein SADUNF_Sadunf06G0049900 [Salix dunnii]|uniref:Auxin-responsive protein n=1 Tax=Salix dunnii TaxID=1413687 RepID=A0A835JXP7_9ROSI|nr:hypothetical protein SADUNF_Sadunf06G0049900 [Salix dunnii]
MELQLGLGLPCEKTMKGLDLNSYVSEPKGLLGSGQLQLGSYSWFPTNDDDKKRSFIDAFEESSRNEDVPRTLPLLVWNNQPNEEDDPPKNLDNQSNNSFSSNKSDGESDGIVGWPPIKFKRKKLGRQNSRVLEVNRAVDNGCGDCQARLSNSMYIKVKMDGAGIARKIDVSLYHSFPTLKHTLLDMFGISQENSSNYRLAYQDREGDWLLTEGTPWRKFLGSVQRLKLTRSSKFN